MIGGSSLWSLLTGRSVGFYQQIKSGQRTATPHSCACVWVVGVWVMEAVCVITHFSRRQFCTSLDCLDAPAAVILRRRVRLACPPPTLYTFDPVVSFISIARKVERSLFPSSTVKSNLCAPRLLVAVYLALVGRL
ncbi:unnamed protein product [Ectocarpus sp. 13 AM-2016]